MFSNILVFTDESLHFLLLQQNEVVLHAAAPWTHKKPDDQANDRQQANDQHPERFCSGRGRTLESFPR
jgi:hypothetical protein